MSELSSAPLLHVTKATGEVPVWGGHAESVWAVDSLWLLASRSGLLLEWAWV